MSNSKVPGNTTEEQVIYLYQLNCPMDDIGPTLGISDRKVEEITTKLIKENKLH